MHVKRLVCYFYPNVTFFQYQISKKKNRGCLIFHVAIKNTRFQSCHSEIRFPHCLKKTQLIMTAMTENFTVNYLLSFEHIIAISTRFFSL